MGEVYDLEVTIRSGRIFPKKLSTHDLNCESHKAAERGLPPWATLLLTV